MGTSVDSGHSLSHVPGLLCLGNRVAGSLRAASAPDGDWGIVRPIASAVLGARVGVVAGTTDRTHEAFEEVREATGFTALGVVGLT